MATRRYGISRGEHFNDVLEEVGAAVVNNSVEVTIDLAASLTREEFFRQLDYIKAKALQGNWPPA